MARTRVAPAAAAILNQATWHRPKRSKRSDGTIGDRAHRRRRSDHNPDSRGIVHAADLTHDPARGVDAHGWAQWLAARRDPRVKLIISNRRSWTPARGWQRYTGTNPHTSHVHVSVHTHHENNTSPWFDGFLYNVGGPPPAPAAPAPVPAAKKLPQRKVLLPKEQSRMVEIAQWELAVATGARFSGEEGVYGLRTIRAIIDLGKILQKNWDGLMIGPDQWAAIDFLYMVKGHDPVLG